MAKQYLFDEGGARRVVDAVRRVEGVDATRPGEDWRWRQTMRFVRVTSTAAEAKDSLGRFPGKMQDYNAAANTFSDLGNCWVIGINGEALAKRRYPAWLAGAVTASGSGLWPVYAVEGVTGGTGDTIEPVTCVRVLKSGSTWTDLQIETQPVTLPAGAVLGEKKCRTSRTDCCTSGSGGGGVIYLPCCPEGTAPLTLTVRVSGLTGDCAGRNGTYTLSYVGNQAPSYYWTGTAWAQQGTMSGQLSWYYSVVSGTSVFYLYVACRTVKPDNGPPVNYWGFALAEQVGFVGVPGMADVLRKVTVTDNETLTFPSCDDLTATKVLTSVAGSGNCGGVSVTIEISPGSVGGGGGATGADYCCPDGLPATLNARITVTAGDCAGLHLQDVALSYNSASGRWEGSLTGKLDFDLACYAAGAGGSANDMYLYVTDKGGRQGIAPTARSCAPFDWEGGGATVTPQDDSCAAVTISVVVTE